jgi:hypothetical protein
MKKYFLLVFVAIITVVFPSFGQVGINTENPLAALDVNGNLRIRKVTTNTTTQNILVLGADSIVYTNTVSNLFPTPTSTVSFVKAAAAANYVLDLGLLTGWNIIPFTVESFDVHNDYNTTTHQFTVPATGVYDIFVQFQSAGLVSVGTVGVAIFRKSGATYNILAQQLSSVSIGLLNTPIMVNLRALLQLNAGDAIYFGAKVPVISASLLGGDNAYFTVSQVH